MHRLIIYYEKWINVITYVCKYFDNVTLIIHQIAKNILFIMRPMTTSWVIIKTDQTSHRVEYGSMHSSVEKQYYL